MKYNVLIFFMMLAFSIAKGQNIVIADSISDVELDSYIRSEENLVMVRDSQDNALSSGNEYTFSSKELLIYPIRTSSVINVIITTSLKKIYAGEIRDLDGRIVKTVPLDALNNEINLKNLNDGKYLLKITSGNTLITEISIIKEPSQYP